MSPAIGDIVVLGNHLYRVDECDECNGPTLTELKYDRPVTRDVHQMHQLLRGMYETALDRARYQHVPAALRERALRELEEES